jgi:hypothetical protein
MECTSSKEKHGKISCLGGQIDERNGMPPSERLALNKEGLDAKGF